MNIAQLSEQLKDVPQNRLIDYARNPNSVVPQFLALAEIQRRQQLSAQVAPPAATVAEDVLAQAQPAPQPVGLPQMAAQQPAQMAQQLPENQPGVAQLQSGMGQGFAPGGLVAFADGGLSLDEDTDEDREMAQLFPTQKLAGIAEMLSAIPSKARELVSNLPKSYEETKLQKATMQPNAKGSHKYEDAVIKEAQRQGIDPNLALHVLYKETGNLKNPESARSRAGALGVMQLMPATAKELGVNPLDPHENIRGGVGYLKKMYDKYGDARLAAAAYNAGPGNVDKALKRSGGLDTLHRETRNYIAGLAQGGEVKRYNGKDDSDVKDDSLEDNAYLKRSRGLVEGIKSLGSNVYDAFTTPRNYDPITKLVLDPAQSVRKWGQTPLDVQAEKFRSYSMNPDRPPTVGYDVPTGSSKSVPSGVVTPSPYGPSENERLHARYPSPIVRPSATPSAQDFRDFDQAAALFQAENANKGITQVAPKSKADLYAEALEKDIEAQAAKAAKAGDMNLALSILQAGFKMMGSKSPYFMQGVGEGGEQGISTFAALKKQEADQAKDLMAARLGLYKYGAAQEAAAETREYNRLYREGETARKTSEAEDRSSDRAFLRYGTRVKQIEDAVRKGYTNNPMYNINPEKFEGEIQSKIAAAKASDQLLNTLAERAGIGAPPKIESGPVIVQTPKGAISFPSKEAADAFKRQAGIK